jgi:hypothetical protein
MNRTVLRKFYINLQLNDMLEVTLEVDLNQLIIKKMKDEKVNQLDFVDERIDIHSTTNRSKQ